MTQEQIPHIPSGNDQSSNDTNYVLSPKERRRLALDEASIAKIMYLVLQ